MRDALDITLLEPHAAKLQTIADRSSQNEAVAYLTLGVSRIANDPWTQLPRTRLVSHQVIDVGQNEKVSASPIHVTWKTDGYMRVLNNAIAGNLVPGIAHTHPSSSAYFSDQDDSNEFELARTAANKGAQGLVSVVFGGDGSVCARWWLADGTRTDAQSVQRTGGRYARWPETACPGDALAHLDRQARLFGCSFNPLLKALKVGIIGAGGTGSAVAMLLTRLGVGHLLLVDNDVVEETNLNRVHGSHASDVQSQTPKVRALEREIRAADLGVNVVAVKNWSSHAEVRDALKSCDFVFGCTDDHSGRLLLNRLAYFYGIPVIDVGLRMLRQNSGHAHDINGRVTTLAPARPCLLCGGVVSPARAAEEALERDDPEEFQRRKTEAYVVGSGDPAPAVVTFTTEMACVAVNEMVAAITGFQGAKGMVPTRLRRFHVRDERFLDITPVEGCRICNLDTSWGRADIEPFLDIVGA